MIANYSKAQITYNNLMTRDRIVNKLINNDMTRVTITMPE